MAMFTEKCYFCRIAALFLRSSAVLSALLTHFCSRTFCDLLPSLKAQSDKSLIASRLHINCIKMTTIELDPEDLTKALRLLHSRATDSSDELKRMLDAYCNKPVRDVSLYLWLVVFYFIFLILI